MRKTIQIVGLKQLEMMGGGWGAKSGPDRRTAYMQARCVSVTSQWYLSFDMAHSQTHTEREECGTEVKGKRLKFT